MHGFEMYLNAITERDDVSTNTEQKKSFEKFAKVKGELEWESADKKKKIFEF